MAASDFLQNKRVRSSRSYWRHIDRYLNNGVLKIIVHVIKHANFQLYRVHSDGVIDDKFITGYVITGLRNGLLITFKKIQKEPPEVFYKKLFF